MKKKISIILSIFILLLALLTLKSYAGYYSNDTAVTSGGTVTITVSSSEALQNYDLKLISYTGLTYNSCSKTSEAGAIVEVNKNSGAISYISTGEGTKTLGTYTFTAPQVTEKTTYKVVFNVDSVTNTSTVTVNPIVTEKPPVDNTTPSTPDTPTTPSTPNTPTLTEKSSNANVKMIETSPVDFKGFKPSKTSGYEVSVENDVDRITVKVTKEDSNASVSLLNRTNSDSGKSWVYIVEGNNEIDITVTSEDGKNKKTYTINVARKAKEVVEEEPTHPEEQEKPEEQEPEVEEPTEEIFGLSELKITEVKLSPEFKTDVYEYKVDLKEDLEKLNITTVSSNSNSKIEITGNEDLQEGENIITIIVKGEVEAETVAYQIIVNKTIPVVENTIILEADHNDMIQKNIIIPVAAGIVLVIIVTAIIITKFSNNNSNNGYIPYENLMDDYEDENGTINNTEDEEVYDEEPRIKRSKGKRFK